MNAHHELCPSARGGLCTCYLAGDGRVLSVIPAMSDPTRIDGAICNDGSYREAGDGGVLPARPRDEGQAIREQMQGALQSGQADAALVLVAPRAPLELLDGREDRGYLVSSQSPEAALVAGLRQALQRAENTNRWNADEIQSNRTHLRSWEEREAACCPEDVSFEEYIAALKKQSEAVLAGLRGLIAQWRENAKYGLVDEATALRDCARELETLLAQALAGRTEQG